MGHSRSLEISTFDRSIVCDSFSVVKMGLSCIFSKINKIVVDNRDFYAPSTLQPAEITVADILTLFDNRARSLVYQVTGVNRLYNTSSVYSQDGQSEMRSLLNESVFFASVMLDA